VRARESGAVAVEFALIVPVLLLMVIGMLEFSLVMRDWLAVASAASAGGRIAVTGAASGDGCPTTVCTPTFAQAAVDAIQTAGNVMPTENIQEIWVYKANLAGFAGSATSQATSACTSNCVRFTWSAPAKKFVAQPGGTWDSTTINACLNATDSLGIYINAAHPMVTKMFGLTFPIRENAVLKFEPQPWGTCAPGSHA